MFVKQDVFFYRGLGLLVVATVVTGLSTILLRSTFRVGWESVVAALVVSAAFHISVFVIFPVTFERSVTMYLLNTLRNAPSQNVCTGYSKKDLERKLVNEYVIEGRAIDKRVNEQSEISFVSKRGACIGLTPRGASFLDLSEKLKRLYAIK